MSKQTTYNASLYLRLSKDDNDCNKESSSISTQRKMLTSYAKENSYNIYDYYVDDGYSGTNFNRPDFMRMIADIEKGLVNMVITKDLSRLGRDYIITGQYTEIYFPTKGVRYIAINDNFDSDENCTDIAPFKNIVNEMYARDTSKKIKSAFITKMKDGNYIGNFAPYGYRKDPQDRNKLLIDENVSDVIKIIFNMAKSGDRPIDIANYLNNELISTPSMYRCFQFPYLNIDNYSKRKEWTSGSVSKILKNIVYIGNLAQGKTTKVSFKTDKVVLKKRDEWIIVENTHEAIIDKETFNIVRKRSISRTNKSRGQFENIFSGIAKCMDCGRNMSTSGTRKKDSVANLVCGGYKLYGSKECSNHFIDYGVLYNIVLGELRKQIQLSQSEKDDLLNSLKTNIDININRTMVDDKNNLLSLESKYNNYDNIIERLYEDNISGKINDDRFNKLLNSYENEQKRISIQIDKIKHKKNKTDELSSNYKKFISFIDKFTNIDELSLEILHELIDYIEIGQGYYEKAGTKKIKKQDIRIFYKFIGELK